MSASFPLPCAYSFGLGMVRRPSRRKAAFFSLVDAEAHLVGAEGVGQGEGINAHRLKLRIGLESVAQKDMHIYSIN